MGEGIDNPTMNRPTSAMRPRALGQGTRVALVAPAGPVSTERITASEARCRALGLEPVVFPHARARAGYLAGSDTERLGDLQAAFDDPTIGAVWALRGGYGTLRIVDALSLDRQREDPIPFIGFSDNTVLHALHDVLGVVSFHGPHPTPEPPREAEAWLRSVLFRAEAPGPLPRCAGDAAPRTLVPGVVEAPLVGGNLTILASMCGAAHELRAKGAILVLEDVGEPAYRVDRLLTQISRSGMLEGAVGLALGRFTGVPDDEDVPPVAEVLAEVAARIDVPTVADLPVGHVAGNMVLPLGVPARLDAGAASLTLLEPAVREG